MWIPDDGGNGFMPMPQNHAFIWLTWLDLHHIAVSDPPPKALHLPRNQKGMKTNAF